MANLKLLVNKEKKQVLYAECDNNFVDILFSFLTVPLGSIVRCTTGYVNNLLNLGCLNTLYKSVGDIDKELLQTSVCRDMLLYPDNPSGGLCKNLKGSIEDIPLTELHYLCPSFTSSPNTHNLVSTRSGAFCHCGEKISRGIPVNKCSNVVDGTDGVFVNGNLKFLISDDLQVSPISTLTTFELLEKLGVRDATMLEVRSERVETQGQVVQLLMHMLRSKTPLTDYFLHKQYIGDVHVTGLDPEDMAPMENDNDNRSKKIGLKLLQSKSKKKVLYAESGEEFPDLLFSFLAFPLGSVVKLLGEKTGMVSLDNLYKSVQDLRLKDCMKSEECTAMLLSPKLAPYFGTKNQPLKIEEQVPWQPILFQCPGNDQYYIAEGSYGECFHCVKRTQLRTINPKCRNGAHEPGGSFLAGPAMFVITDELIVQPRSPISGVSFVNKFSIPISDLEEVNVSVGEMEALSLLRACLKSKTVLSDVFRPRRRRRKCQLDFSCSIGSSC